MHVLLRRWIMHRYLLLILCALLLSGCWRLGLGVMTWTVIPSIVRGAEMRAAREASVGPVVEEK